MLSSCLLFKVLGVTNSLCSIIILLKDFKSCSVGGKKEPTLDPVQVLTVACAKSQNATGLARRLD